MPQYPSSMTHVTRSGSIRIVNNGNGTVSASVRRVALVLKPHFRD